MWSNLITLEILVAALIPFISTINLVYRASRGVVAFKPLSLGLTKIWVKMSSFYRTLKGREVASNTGTSFCRGALFSK